MHLKDLLMFNVVLLSHWCVCTLYLHYFHEKKAFLCFIP